MFSLDDDSFDLNEEDLLQGAITVEKDAVLPKRTTFSLPAQNNEVNIAVVNNNLLGARNNFAPPKNGEKQIQDSGALFSIGGDGDDSVFDLSLDSPLKWNAGAPKQNAPQDTSTPLIADAHPLQPVLTKRKSFGEPLSPQAHCSRTIDKEPDRDGFLATPESIRISFNKSAGQNARQVACQRHDYPTAQSSEIFSPEPGTSAMANTRRSNSMIKNQSNIFNSSFTDPEDSPSFSTPKSVSSKPRRKFPGPAGLLPKLKPGENLSELTSDAAIPEVISKKPVTEDDLPSSQCTEDQFQDGLWQKMLRELEPNARKLMKKFPINCINRKADKKQLPSGKVPVLGAVLETISFKNSDASVSLKDPSGRIRGTVHRDVVKEHGNILQPGSVLVLRQIGVFNPLSRNHYLNITPSNVVRIYSNNIEGGSRFVTINDFLPEDFNVTENKPASSPGLSGSPLASPSLPWNTVGHGGTHGTPRPSNFASGSLVRPTQPTRFVRTPQLGAVNPSTPRSSFVRHTYGTPSVAPPAVGASQVQRSPSVTLNSGGMSNSTVAASNSQIIPASNAMRSPEPVPNAGNRPQTSQNNTIHAPRLRTPNMPAVNVRTPTQSVNSVIADCLTVSSNHGLRTPQMAHTGGNIHSQNCVVFAPSTPVLQAQVASISNINSSSTNFTSANTRNQPLANTSANLNVNSATSTFKTPRNPNTPKFIPPFNAIGGNSQPVSNLNRALFGNTAQSPITCANANQSQTEGKTTCTVQNQLIAKPQTPGKFTFKRKAVSAPLCDTAKKQQVSAPSTGHSTNCSNLQNIDPHDLLAGLENELLDDDF